MTSARLVGPACLLFIAITAIWIYCTRTHISPLQRFYIDLVHHYDPSKLPKLEDVSKVLNQVPDARPGEITNALPAIMAAFAHRDDTVKAYACTALFAIGRRPDSAKLLNQYTDVLIQDVSDTSNPNIRAGEIVILGGLRPVPPPQVVPSFLAFLKRTDIGVQAQGSGVIFELVQIAPDDPEVITAIREFLSRPLDSTTRIGALNAVGNPKVKDAGLVAMVVASLDDADQGVRFTGIEVLGRMGRNALLRGEPELQRLANDPKQPTNVSNAAKEALKGIQGRTN